MAMHTGNKRDPLITERNKKRKKDKRAKRRAYWKDNKEYLEKQKKRAERISSYAPGVKFANKANNEEANKKRTEEKKARNKIRGRGQSFSR